MNHPLPRHVIFLLSAGIGVLSFAAAFALSHPLALTIGANAFFGSFVALVLYDMPLLTADYLSKYAQKADLPVLVIFLVTLAVVCVAVGSLFFLINEREDPSVPALILSLIAVPLGWLTIHIMAALHYAHIYWLAKPGSHREPKGHRGGLHFPGGEPPCGADFLYFSVIIGVAAQTADVDTTTTEMRSISLVHSVLSFYFNTVILAAAVNLVVSLAN